jgi:hypothetical protein
VPWRYVCAAAAATVPSGRSSCAFNAVVPEGRVHRPELRIHR